MDAEVWKWIAITLGGVVIGEGAALWRVTVSIKDRPTFTDVKRMITDHEDATGYAKDRRWIEEKFAQLQRHVDETRDRVAEIHLSLMADREARAVLAAAQVARDKLESRE
jgi:hypothetical protein